MPDGDVLLHAGDISAGIPESVKSMFDWLKGLPHETKVSAALSVLWSSYLCLTIFSSVIAGNHDVRLGAVVVQSKVVLLQLVVMSGQDVASWGSYGNNRFRQDGEWDPICNN